MVMALVCASIFGATAYGHGSSINVHQNSNELSVSGGLSLAQGFVDLAWDPHEDASLDDASNDRRTLTFPGYNATGMDSSAPLMLEVISRPDYTVPGNPERWLWYWSTSAKVTAVPANARFDVVPLFVVGVDPIQIREAELVTGPSTTMANPIGPFMGFHSHLVNYELHNASASQPGVYAFFVRVASPGVEPSDPFLLAFRNLISDEFFAEAANDINKAAMPSGDFNFDGIVDAADYATWRKTLGGGDEYAAWRQNFGTVIGDSGGGGFEDAAAVPEPASAALGVCIYALAAMRPRSRRS